MSQTGGTDGRLGGRPGGTDGRPAGRFGAATPGARSERASIGDLVAMPGQRAGAGRRRLVTPWRLTALIAAVLVAAGSYALGRYVTAPKPAPTVSLAVTATALPAGARLSTSDLSVVTVSRASAPSGAMTPAAAAGLIGLVTKNPVPARAFIEPGMLSGAGGMPDARHALVGLALKPGQLPAGGLAVGQQVEIVLLPVSAQGVPLNPVTLTNTTIWDLPAPDSSGDEEATVLVPSWMASRLASYAARGQVSLIATATPGQRTSASRYCRRIHRQD